MPLMKAAVQLPAEPQVACRDGAGRPRACSTSPAAPPRTCRSSLRAQIRPKRVRPPPELRALHLRQRRGARRACAAAASEDEDERSTDGAGKPGVHQRQRPDARRRRHRARDDHRPAAGGHAARAARRARVPRSRTARCRPCRRRCRCGRRRWLVGIQPERLGGARTTDRSARSRWSTSRGTAGRRARRSRSTSASARTYSHRKRLVGGFYAYEHVEEIGPSLGTLCAGRDRRARAARCASGAPPADGDLILQAAVDRRGRATSAAHTGASGSTGDGRRGGSTSTTATASTSCRRSRATSPARRRASRCACRSARRRRWSPSSARACSTRAVVHALRQGPGRRGAGHGRLRAERLRLGPRGARPRRRRAADGDGRSRQAGLQARHRRDPRRLARRTSCRSTVERRTAPIYRVREHAAVQIAVRTADGERAAGGQRGRARRGRRGPARARSRTRAGTCSTR